MKSAVGNRALARLGAQSVPRRLGSASFYRRDFPKRFPLRSRIFAGLLFFLAGAPSSSLGQKTKHEKAVWNYDGGVFFETDGSLPNGVCFRVSGHLRSPTFFDNLKRIDTEQGVVFRRGTETVAQFPDELVLSFVIRDLSCTPGLSPAGKRMYLTREMMSTLYLSLYWKRGVELRPLKVSKELRASVERIEPFAASLTAELPKRFEWSYEIAVSSSGVPVSDSLVLVFRPPDGRIAARVAARL